ncbi:hypothetical protein [Cohnella phaseoli]|uniref:Flp pilus-assembly TadE/G-like protein n=1 Tax=Cohnella phaseoli TaxID=456490 RepID=A0A3D9JR03_9BACL|nr:hypothetical protein [Cohnella phaseoli]RED75977.1 hypothetical protein DFP98_11337 [Cohnella phaseoli]
MITRIKRTMKCNQGVATLITTIWIMPILMVLCFSIIPFFVYSMKHDKLISIVNHALEEVQDVGLMSSTIIQNTNDRLSEIGMGSISINGNGYPSYSGSTFNKVLKDDPDPTVSVVLKYPAPNITKIIRAIGGNGSSEETEGFYQITVFARSEAYE